MFLCPKPIYWLCKYFIILVIAFGLLIFRSYMDDQYLVEGMLYLSLFLFLVLVYTYIDMLFCTSWHITEERIQLKRGVFYKKRDYIELYRVVDYEETQSLIQMIFLNKTVTIISGDKTHPVLKIYGIDNKILLIDYIRTRVEKQKRLHGIYEVTNR